MRPKLEYSSCVWDPHTKSNISKLEMVQRRAARYTCNRFEAVECGTLYSSSWEQVPLYNGFQIEGVFMSLSLYGYVYMSGCVCIVVFYCQMVLVGWLDI
jgi:hypothetical protein